MKRRNLTRILAVAITIILVILLLSRIELKDIATTLAKIKPLYLLIGFGLYLGSYWLRTLRFHILLKGEVRLRDLFPIVCVHNMVNNILPARTGELSYIFLLKKLHQRKIEEGIATLIVARLFDFMAISIIFFVSILGVRDLPVVISKVIGIIAGFLVLVVLILISFLYFGDKFIYIARRFAVRLKLNTRPVNYVLKKGEEIVQFLEGKTKRTVLQLFLVSVGLWITSCMLAVVLVTGIRLELTVFEILVCISFLAVITSLPIQGILGLGTTEGAWSIALLLFGVSKEVAIPSSFGLHIMVLGYLAILGFYGIKKLKFKFR